MSTASGSGRWVATSSAMRELQTIAARSAEALLHHVPDSGDHDTGRVVDDFVEQASDALRALAECVTETLDHQSNGRTSRPGPEEQELETTGPLELGQRRPGWRR